MPINHKFNQKKRRVDTMFENSILLNYSSVIPVRLTVRQREIWQVYIYRGKLQKTLNFVDLSGATIPKRERVSVYGNPLKTTKTDCYQYVMNSKEYI